MLNKLRNKKNNKGFTLVELLVVIAIIGILAVVAVPSLMKNINKAKAADAVAYISAARTAVLSEYVTTNEAPTEADVMALVEGKPDSITGITDIKDGVAADFASHVVMEVTTTDAKIAEQVAAQLGEDTAKSTANRAIVTVKLYKGKLPTQ